MSNSQLSKLFTTIANLQDILNTPWKPGAFRRAAQSLDALDEEAEQLYHKKGLSGLRAIPGVGESIARKIEEYITKGTIKELERLQKKVPKGVLALLNIQGIGPKKAALLWKQLNIKTITDVERAGRTGRIATLKGFGKLSEEHILSELQKHQEKKRRYQYKEALTTAISIKNALDNVQGVEIATIAGSIRRKEPTIGDIDILVVATNPELAIKTFTTLDDVAEVLAKGPTKSSVTLKNGMQADIRVILRESYAAALQYFTGNKAHNIKLREIARKKKLKLSEYGLYNKKGTNIAKGINEKKVYTVLGLTMPPPEKRKGGKELPT